MVISPDGQTYYTTPEACKLAGVSKSTFLRWVSESTVKDASHRDRRGWRLFTEDDVKRISDEKSRIDRV